LKTTFGYTRFIFSAPAASVFNSLAKFVNKQHADLLVMVNIVNKQTTNCIMKFLQNGRFSAGKFVIFNN